jgi:hypothetical protein
MVTTVLFVIFTVEATPADKGQGYPEKKDEYEDWSGEDVPQDRDWGGEDDCGIIMADDAGQDCGSQDNGQDWGDDGQDQDQGQNGA